MEKKHKKKLNEAEAAVAVTRTGVRLRNSAAETGETRTKERLVGPGHTSNGARAVAMNKSELEP